MEGQPGAGAMGTGMENGVAHHFAGEQHSGFGDTLQAPVHEPSTHEMPGVSDMVWGGDHCDGGFDIGSDDDGLGMTVLEAYAQISARSTVGGF